MAYTYLTLYNYLDDGHAYGEAELSALLRWATDPDHACELHVARTMRDIIRITSDDDTQTLLHMRFLGFLSEQQLQSEWFRMIERRHFEPIDARQALVKRWNLTI